MGVSSRFAYTSRHRRRTLVPLTSENAVHQNRKPHTGKWVGCSLQRSGMFIVLESEGFGTPLGVPYSL